MSCPGSGSPPQVPALLHGRRAESGNIAPSTGRVCRALQASSSENPATVDGSDEDDEFFQLPQASPSSTEVQQWVNDPATSLSELSKFPKIMKMFIQRNTGIPPSAPPERLFSRGRDVFTIKRKKLSDSNFEKQLILCYNDVCK